MLFPSSMPFNTQHTGRMAEWSKALVLGTSHFGGVVSRDPQSVVSGWLEDVGGPGVFKHANGNFYHLARN